MIKITNSHYNIALSNGISKQLLKLRVNVLKWSLNKAITEPVREQNTKAWLNIARKNGIKKKTFYSRIYSLGWDAEKSATYPVNRKTVKDKLHDELLEFYCESCLGEQYGCCISCKNGDKINNILSKYIINKKVDKNV